jgi:hypothetical protein
VGVAPVLASCVARYEWMASGEVLTGGKGVVAG